MRLLLTRPEPDAQRTAAALRIQGHQVHNAPLLRVELLADAKIDDGPWAAVLITSANAARAIVAHARVTHLHALPVFTVGRRTADAAHSAGFSNVTSAEGNVGDLVRFIAERMRPPARLLYLGGEDRSGDLAGDLRAKGFAVDMVVVYRATAVSSLPSAADDALTQGIDGVLHFSRRSAETYVAVAREAGVLAHALKPVHFCLSAQVAAPLREAGAADVRIAREPVEAALIALIGAA